MIRIALSLVLLSLLLTSGCDKPQTAAPPPAVKTITTPTGIEMSLIPAGSFTMGSDKGDEDDEKPAHSVTVAGFYMDRYEVTQKSYEGLMGTNPAKFKDPQKPVERVSWVSAIKYCNLRSMKEKLQPCYDLQTAECNFAANGYRLPTEAEWEYACRAGSTGDFSFGDNAAELAANAWLKDNSSQTTHPVGQKPANKWALFDMYGNVSEWCNDRYSDKEYAAKATDNPHGPATGNERVLRGGSWKAPANQCRSTARASQTPGLADACFGSETYGFRCVRSANEAVAAK